MKSIKQLRESNLEEASKKKSSDMARVNAGAMSKSEFDAKWKKPVKKKLGGPGGLYKNLVKEENVDEAHGAGEWGTDELTNKYKNATPGQSSSVTEEKNFKVTFAHKHPEGEKKHEYVVKAKHQNDADHKAIAMHQKAHPNGKFTMWDSQQIDEESVNVVEGSLSYHMEKAIGAEARGDAKMKLHHLENAHHAAIAMSSADVPKHIDTLNKLHAMRKASEMKEGASEDMAKHHDAAQAAKAAGDNDAFHKHMDAKYEVAKKRDAENAKKPVSRMGEALEDACWKGYEAIGMKMKNGKKVPNCVPKESVEESLDESVHGVKAAKFSQQAKLKPSVATHVRASDSHIKAASAYEKKIAAHIKSGGEPSHLKPFEDMLKHHNRSATLHKFMAHRLIKHKMTEAVETTTEAADEQINLKITRHSQLAINAGKRGDTAAQKFHLAMVSKLKANESTVNEASEYDDNDEEVIMAKGQLLKIADMAKDLAASMDDQDELEAWIQVKITTAYDQMDDVHSYVEYTQDLYDDQPEAEKEFATESTIEPSVTDAKELARMRMLVRLGLLDRLKLNTVTRAIRKLDNNVPVTTIAEKEVLFELLQNLIAAITTDDTVFRKVKFNVATK